MIPVSNLFIGSNIFIIPTFQRPYSWEEPQWQDLIRDLSIAADRQAIIGNTIHYFSAIHTILVDHKDPLLINYIDENNLDIQGLLGCGFIANFQNYEVHIVIDGQQRLITLFALLERCGHTPQRYVDLPNGRRIPRLILNPAPDHTHWRYLLGLGQVAPLCETRSQQRLHDLFNHFGQHGFPLENHPNNPECTFLISQSTKLNWIQLPAGFTLAPFLTLNDRGKDLTKLEKVKSLAMEADANWNAGGLAHDLNNCFGEIYRSIDRNESLLKEDDLLRQLAIALWEARIDQPDGRNDDQGQPLTYPRVHDESLEYLYQLYRVYLSKRPNHANALVSDILVRGNILVYEHNALAAHLKDARNAINIGQPSFVNAIFPTEPPRDAYHDYQMVLDSLGLQTKQLAILLAVRHRYGVAWHEPLGVMRVSNTDIKRELHQLAVQYVNLNNTWAQPIGDTEWAIQIKQEIDSIPDEREREVTPLYLAELLRLIVGTSKPGNFRWNWEYGFGDRIINSQEFLDAWTGYLLSNGSRYRFIIWRIAQNSNLDNQSPDLRYLLREFECRLPGGLNAHAQAANIQIEHFFGRAFNLIENMPGHGFAGEPDYMQEFVDRPGNKLILHAQDNQILNMTPVNQKVQAYNNPNFTQSAQQIAHDLHGNQHLGLLRQYVMLRQLRLAAFAAKRF